MKASFWRTKQTNNYQTCCQRFNPLFFFSLTSYLICLQPKATVKFKTDSGNLLGSHTYHSKKWNSNSSLLSLWSCSRSFETTSASHNRPSVIWCFVWMWKLLYLPCGCVMTWVHYTGDTSPCLTSTHAWEQAIYYIMPAKPFTIKMTS